MKANKLRHAMSRARSGGYQDGYNRAVGFYAGGGIQVLKYSQNIYWIEQHGKGEALSKKEAKERFARLAKKP